MHADDAAIMASLQKSVDAGNAAAICALGEFYMHGMHGLTRNLQKAEELLGQSASMGYVHGIFLQGKVIEVSTYGKLFQQDRIKKYWELYEQAAEKGHGVAQFMVGAFYSGEYPYFNKMLNKPANKAQAYSWFAKSAEAGWKYSIVKEAEYRSYK